jgi:hypothetical protein
MTLKGGDTVAEEYMILRFRHDMKIGDVAYAAGQKERVPVSDEAWKAVNEGHADCDPPPGTTVGEWTQPLPPDWVTGGPSTVVPMPGTPPKALTGKTGPVHSEEPPRAPESAPQPLRRR